MANQGSSDSMVSPSFVSDCSENCDLTTRAKECLQEMLNYKREVKVLQQRISKIRVEAAMMLAEFSTLHDPLMSHNLALAYQDFDHTLSSLEQMNSSGFSSQNQMYQPTSESTLEEISSNIEGASQRVTDFSSVDDSAIPKVTGGFSEGKGNTPALPMMSPDVD